MSSKVKKVVLAYSGGLDSSVIVRWLIETYGCEVITLTGDVGQKQELEGLEKKALATGAVKAYGRLERGIRERFCLPGPAGQCGI